MEVYIVYYVSNFAQNRNIGLKLLHVSLLRFLASSGFPFREDNQNIGSAENGNYLGVLGLLSEFGPFLEEHLKFYKTKSVVFISKYL